MGDEHDTNGHDGAIDDDRSHGRDNHEHGQDDTHEHDHGHNHDHGHDHDHSSSSGDPDELTARARALHSLLVEKGLITTNAIEEVIRLFEEDVGPMHGARVVARAWTDPEFKAQLLEEPNAAVRTFDYDIGQQHLAVVENTPTVHNAVVCTLCSCYPWSLLGLPPTWYKSPSYRSRMVREPRAVLSEFGVELDPSVDVAVWDSSSEIRYVVLPQRPPQTDGLEEAELAELVTRDAMVGVERLGEP